MSEIETRPRLYCCVGMRRSGSTLQANLVAAVLGEGARIEVTSPEAFAAQAPVAEATRPLVLKCHRFIPEIAAMLGAGQACVFHSYRDIRDVVASIMEKYSVPALGYLHGGAQAIVDEYEAWAALPGVYIGCYEAALADPVGEVRRLAAHAGLSCDEDRARRIAAEFSLERQQQRIDAASEGSNTLVGAGGNAHDRGTLLHLNHIQSGGSGAYRTVLSRRELAALEWVCGDWMRAHGYRPDYPRWLQWLAHTSYRTRAGLHSIRAGTPSGTGKPAQRGSR